MGRIFGNDNPGLGGLDELTDAETLFIQNLSALSYAQGDILYHNGTSITRLPAGTSGYYLKTLGAGANPVWADVSATPGGSDTQVQFNDGGTLSGEAGMTYNKTTDTLTLAGGIVVGSSNPFSDSAGTLTLQNVDALDATTEATIEAAIDTLANLTSIQGKTFTLAGNFVTSGAFALTLTQTGATNVTLPTTGTLSTLAGSETLTNKTISGASNTLSNIGNASLSNSAITIAGTSTSLGGTITLDTITGLASTGVVKRSAANTFAIATAGTDYVAPGGALGTPSSGTLTNCSGLPVSGITASTVTALGVGSIELGHASDTTIARVSAGVVSIEGVNIVTVSSTDTLTNKTLTAPKFADTGYIADNNGNEQIKFSTTASAVNELTFKNAATGGAPDIQATGGDTNIDIKLTPKGTGKVAPQASVNFGAKTAYFTETDNGNSGTADTIDWTVSNKQKSTLTGNCTFTFTAPPGPCSLILKLVQDGTGSRTVTWPAAVHWSGGTAPTLTTTASKVDIISFYFDGSVYYGNYSLNFTA